MIGAIQVTVANRQIDDRRVGRAFVLDVWIGSAVIKKVKLVAPELICTGSRVLEENLKTTGVTAVGVV